MTEVRQIWEDDESATEKVKRRRLEWLDHLARMSDHRPPKLSYSVGYPNPDPDVGQERGVET